MKKLYGVLLILAIFQTSLSSAGIFKSLEYGASRCYSAVRAHKKIAVLVGAGFVCMVGGISSCVIVEQAGIPPNSAKTAGYNENINDPNQLTAVSIGDSLSTGYSADPYRLVAFRDMRRSLRDKNWFLNVGDSAESSMSIFGKVRVERKFVNLATSAAAVGEGSNHKNPAFRKYSAKIEDFEDQMDSALALKPFPNLFTIEIGTNNVDWADYIVEESAIVKADYDLVADPDKVVPIYIRESTESFERKFELEIERIANNPAVNVRYPVEVVVFGIPDLKSFFPLLDSYPQEKSATVYGVFPSFLPKHRAVTLDFRSRMNNALKELTDRKNKEFLASGRSIKIIYSEAFGKFPYSKPGVLSPKDGFHLSPFGHGVLSEIMMVDLAGRSRWFPAQTP